MKHTYLLLALLPLLCYGIYGCSENSQAANAKIAVEAPHVDYKVVNASEYDKNLNYDVYVTDTTAIKKLNGYLRTKFNPENKSWIQIKYYNDSLVAKNYMKDMADRSVSEDKKNEQFKSFIACYSHNPSTGYDSLGYEHAK